MYLFVLFNIHKGVEKMRNLLLGIGIGYTIYGIVALIKEHLLRERMWKNIKRYLYQDDIIAGEQESKESRTTYSEELYHRFLDIHDEVQVYLQEKNEKYLDIHLSNIPLRKRARRLVDRMEENDRILIWKYMENRSIIDLMEKEEIFYRGIKEGLDR